MLSIFLIIKNESSVIKLMFPLFWTQQKTYCLSIKNHFASRDSLKSAIIKSPYLFLINFDVFWKLLCLFICLFSGHSFFVPYETNIIRGLLGLKLRKMIALYLFAKWFEVKKVFEQVFILSALYLISFCFIEINAI